MNAQVSVVMGSISDWSTMKLTGEILDKLNVPYEKQVVSAHRMPTELMKFGQTAREREIKVIIAGAGGAAHLPGMLAANTIIPVIGVPIQTHALGGMDSLLSIGQMPAGVPVATMAIGAAGARNAALMACEMLTLNDDALADRLVDYRRQQHDAAVESSAHLE